MLFSVVYACVLWVLINSFNISSAKEKVCSKFAYEEQTLEKMIRTEIKVENIASEIKKTQDSVLNTLKEMQMTVAHITDRFEDLRNNFTEEMEQKTQDIEKREEKLTWPSVAFYAHHVTHTNLDKTDNIIVFDSAPTNEGSGYDTSTGIFTAPVDGMYQFTVHICTYGGKHSYVGLVYAGNVIAKASNYDKDGNTCSSVGAIARVKSGEQVWVTCTAGGSNHILTENIYRRNTFSGILLNK